MENLTSKVKYLSHKKAAKGQRCKGKILRLSETILLVPDLSFWPLLSPKKEVLENNEASLATLRTAQAKKAVCSKLSSLLLFLV